MKSVSIWLVVILAVFVVNSAQAEDGFYTGAAVQRTSLGVDYLSSDEATATGGRFFVGYAISPQFAVEAVYLNSGWATWTAPGAQVDLRATALSLSFLGSIPLSDRFHLFGKAGYYDGEADYQAWASGMGTYVFSEDLDGVTLGAGVRYDVGRFSWRLEYDWYNVDNGTADTLGLAAQIRF